MSHKPENQSIEEILSTLHVDIRTGISAEEAGAWSRQSEGPSSWFSECRPGLSGFVRLPALANHRRCLVIL